MTKRPNPEQTTLWAELLSGVAVDPTTMTADDIVTTDVARSLALQCRYCGHLKEPRTYSVAEHSVHVHDYIVANWASFARLGRLHDGADRRAVRRIRAGALLHDGSEYVLGDPTKPLKPKLGGYFEYEARVMGLFAVRFDFDLPLHEVIKEVDCRIVHDERRALFNNSGRDWSLPFAEPLGIEIPWWTPAEAERQFLSRLNELMP